MKEKAISYLINFLIIYCLLLAAMFLFQRKLMYFPSTKLLEPQTYGVQAQAITLPTVDGVELTAWAMPAAKAMPTVLHMHGNAGNISDRHEVYSAYHAAGFGVLALEWRGYGTSKGSPSEEGFYTDARTAISYLKDQGLSESDIILYGESIGTGIAVQMATEITPKALLLEAPFTSLWKRAAEIHWYMPVKWMVWDKYDSLSKIETVKAPLLIFHNTGDKIVPYRHGQALFEAASEPKEIVTFESNQHVAFDRPLLVQKTKEFLALE